MRAPWQRLALLKNPVLEYAWGSKTFLPDLLNDSSPSKEPKAELWMGTHSKAPSRVYWDNSWISLSRAIRENPIAILGKEVAERFSNQLPFLFKVLAAEIPLSVQAHPDREMALEGFDCENRSGIPLDAPNRNYRDQRHKPEIVCALTPFWVLKGFRPTGQIIQFVDALGVPALREACDVFDRCPKQEGLKGFFSSIMAADPARKAEIVSQGVAGAQKRADRDTAFEWMCRLNRHFPGDAGVLAPLFLNLVCLQPGEAMAIACGELHAYLEGAAVELMVNSDNVLRGGLTVKHVDIGELLRVLRFSETSVHILKPAWETSQEGVYPTRTEEFVLSVIEARTGAPFVSRRNRAVEIMICSAGSAEISDMGRDDTLSLSKGTSLMVPAAIKQYAIHGDATIYKASVPLS